jgi:mannose-6-phosphate isomerase-like protein (cupin superfamily)
LFCESGVVHAVTIHEAGWIFACKNDIILSSIDIYGISSIKLATLHLSDFLTEPQRFLVAHNHIATKDEPNSHRHDFAEFFWGTSGTCEHVYQGGSEILNEGDIRFVCPEYAHEFRALGC